MYYKYLLELIICLFLAVCAVTDCFCRKIWMPVLLPAGLASLFCVAGMEGNVVSHLVCGILAGAGFWWISIVTGGQIEKGDGAVLGVMGLALGIWKGVVFLFFSFTYAFFAALILVTVGKKKRSYRMPFVPFALAGYLTVLAMGGV